MKSLEEEKKFHNRLVYISFGVIVLIGALLIGFTTVKADGVPAVQQKAVGCNFNNEVCRILDKQQHIAYDATHSRADAPYNYTSGEMTTIRNHPGQLGNTAGLYHYNNPGSGWDLRHTGPGVAKLTHHAYGFHGKRASCVNWERWTFTGKQDSTLGADLFDYTMRVNACFARNANGSWRVTSLNADDTVANKSGLTVQVNGWESNVNPPVPENWSRISTKRDISNCVNGWKPFCSRGWHIQIQMVVFGVNHYRVEQTSWV